MSASQGSVVSLAAHSAVRVLASAISLRFNGCKMFNTTVLPALLGIASNA